jgi:cell wall-associated NlpC family hydrolase
MSLPPELQIAAALEAVRENPANRPRTAGGVVLPREELAVVTSRYWGPGGVDLSVQFLDSPAADLRAKILQYANLWASRGNVNIKFRETKGRGDIRLARTRGDGYWSYVGTDIRSIPANQPTLNLDSFTMATPDSEFLRVVPHEFGHSAGFPHEHMRGELVSLLDPEKTIAYFGQHYGWSADETEQQVLTPLSEASIRGTPHADATSIMCYQIDGSCTKSGQPIPGGLTIDDSDYDFAAKLYPVATPPPPAPPPPPPPAADLQHARVDWGAKLVKIPDRSWRVEYLSAASNNTGAGMFPYPTEFPVSEISAILGYLRGSPPETADLLHCGWTLAGYALAQSHLGASAAAAPAPRGKVTGKLELRLEELLKRREVLAAAGPGGFDWRALLKQVLQLVAGLL